MYRKFEPILTTLLSRTDLDAFNMSVAINTRDVWFTMFDTTCGYVFDKWLSYLKDRYFIVNV